MVRRHGEPGSGSELSRVTARVVPGDLLRTPAVVGHIRVVVTGAEGTRLHEEVVVAGGTIEGRQAGPRHRGRPGGTGSAAASDELPTEQVLEQAHRAVADAGRPLVRRPGQPGQRPAAAAWPS